MEITYNKFKLRKGKCLSCSEKSNEILIKKGICIDCEEEQRFYDETMK